MWIHTVNLVSALYKKDTHLWLQTFGVEKDDIGLPQELSEVMGNINRAVWGFNGCKSVFPQQGTDGTTTAEVMWQEIKRLYAALKEEQLSA